MYALDPRLTNPRRPKKAKLTAEEQEDQLIPYQEMLPLQHTMYATLDKQVYGQAEELKGVGGYEVEGTSSAHVHLRCCRLG